MHWKVILILIGGTCFCVSSAAFFYVKIALRPKRNHAAEETFWEFEDRDPALRRYQFWCRILFTATILSMTLLFIAISV